MSEAYVPSLAPICVSCLVKKQMDRYPADATREQVLTYLRRLGNLMANLPDRSSGPALMEAITALRYELFGDAARRMDGDFDAIKRHFNAYMMDFAAEVDLPARIHAADDPLRVALGISMTGNFIDFGAMDSIDKNHLSELMARAAEQVSVDSEVYGRLTKDLASACRLVFLTDNCGEIVLDRLLIELLRERYPDLSITVLVRGANVLNDATMEDARQVGLDVVAGLTVMGNGDGLAGTSLGRISPAARATIDKADVIIAKGQGNYETLRGCGLNVYYAFLCKCRMFADRFDVPLYTGMLTHEMAEEDI